MVMIHLIQEVFRLPLLSTLNVPPDSYFNQSIVRSSASFFDLRRSRTNIDLHPMASAPPTPLLAVSLLFRSKPQFDGIDHVVHTVSSYADSSIELPLSKACKFQSVTLLDRIWSSTVDLAPNGWGLWSVRKLLRTHRLYGKLQFSLCLLEAAKVNNVEIVRWLFEHFPDFGVRRKVVCEAATAGALETLQFFRANAATVTNDEEDEVEGDWDEEGENWSRGRWVRFGGLDAQQAALGGHTAVVKWMYETYAHEDRNDYSVIDGAFITGDMALADWVMHKVGMDPEGHEALFGAASNGHVEPLQWYQDHGIYTSWDAGTLIKAAEAGHLNVVRWIIDRDGNDAKLGTEIGPDEFNIEYSFAGRTRRTRLTCLGGEASLAIHAAAINGHLEVAKYLRSCIDVPRNCDEQLMEPERLERRIEALSRRLGRDSNTEKVSGRTMLFAAAKGFVDVVQWLYSEYPRINLFWAYGYLGDDFILVDEEYEGDESCTFTSVVDAAAANGHLEIVQFLLEVVREEGDERSTKRRRVQVYPDNVTRGLPQLSPSEQLPNETGRPACTKAAMDGAAARGHLDVVRWLHANCSEGCTVAAMDLAAKNGHLHVIEWLHENRLEGGTTDAIDYASRSGHLEVLKWLHNHRREGCTTRAMDYAAGTGFFEVVTWLHANRPEGCTVAALDGAAAYGEMKIVRWLHENRVGRCSTLAMSNTAHKGHLRVLRWLFENRSEGFTQRALDNAGLFAQFEAALILHGLAQHGLAKEVEVKDAAASEKWISDVYHQIAATTLSEPTE
jgi:hypothetical protein